MERLNTENKLDSIFNGTHKIDTDILILTEFDDLKLTDYPFIGVTDQLN